MYVGIYNVEKPKNSCQLGPKPIKVTLIHWLQIFRLCEHFIFYIQSVKDIELIFDS